MRRNLKNNPSISIKDLMSDIDQDTYTGQTIQSLFRCFLETIIENRSEAVILLKVNDAEKFKNILNRLKYTSTKVYSYSDNIDEFKQIKLDSAQKENDEFFVIIAERFSACLYWNKGYLDTFDLYEGFCSLNPGETKRIVEHLQSVAFDKELEKDLSDILQDRRNNEKFTIILRKIVSDLENRQRDLICANSELREFQKKPGQKEQIASLNQLFSTVMHELRNPLGAIGLHTKIISKKMELIRDKKVENIDDVIKSVELISKTTEELEKTLNELLDFSKPLSLEKTELNLQEAVNEIVNLIKPSYDNKNVKLKFENSFNGVFLVNFDRSKLHQVIFNILKNALEASKQEKEVNVLLKNNKDNVNIEISDQGDGISKENRKKIFEPYFTTKKEGTGLGLAQAKKVIEAHDGTLSIASETSEGTTFIISLPAKSFGISQ